LVEYNPTGSTVNGLAAGEARHYGGLGGSGGFSTLFSDDENIDALHILDNGHIILSTDGNATLGGLSFEEGDLVDYNPLTGTASLYFDGDLFSDDENIDAVHILDNGHIILSTEGNASLGGLSFNDEDLVEYDPVAGTASLYFDGSAHDLSGNDDIDAVHLTDPMASRDTITDFNKAEDVLHFADVFDGGSGDGLSLSDLISGGFIGLDSSANIGGGGANDTVITIDVDGSAGTTYTPVVAVNVLDVTLTAADTGNFIV
jgi:hypothetical protein